MSIQVKRRREAASFLATYTGAQGELLVDTTNNRVQVHDGATAGGFPAAKLSEVAGLAPVQSVAGRTGAVTLGVADVAGAAPLTSPAFAGSPTAPTPATSDSSTRIATTAWVAAQGYGTGSGASAVTSVAGRTGAVTLAIGDVSGAAPLASPALTGTPTAPNAAAGTNTAQIATTSFVAASFVTYAYATANYATSANATLTGTPTAPTQGVGDNSTRLATTAYADRAASANFARTQVNDASYTVLASDRTVAMIAITAARALTLPKASSFPSGATLTIVDESGACSSTNTITLLPNGSDTINGVASAALATPYAFLALESNTSNKWTIVDFAGATTQQLTNRNIVINGNFGINQRAYASNAALAAGAYAHDRWKAGSGGCTYTFSQAVPDTSVSIANGSLMQVVDGANAYASVCWLTWTGTAPARVYQGAASSQTSPAYAAGTPVTIGGTNVNALLVSALTLGTAINIEFGTGTLGLVQLEAALPNCGPTRFERRQYGIELMLCQRYYYQTTGGGYYVYQNSSYASAGGQFIVATIPIPTMRTTPTMGVIGTPVLTNSQNFGFYSGSPSSAVMQFTSAAAGTAAAWNSQGGGFYASAEL